MITRLDAASARKLSAGQVITDLSSVLKELLENSLDAGSRTVTVRIDNYGIDRITVEDDGCGIALAGLQDEHDSLQMDSVPTAVPLLACRATTKYDHGDGVPEALVRGSLGFRGEALHSLASVSEVAVHTMTAVSQPVCVSITYDSGAHQSTARVSQERQTPGTTVTVSALFRSLPVRHKEFTKNRKRQLLAATTLMKQYALSHPQVRLLVTHRADLQSAPATLVSLTGTNDPQRALAEAYGGRYLADMVWVEWDLSFGVVAGYVSRPSSGRLTPDMQICALDGRLVDLPKLAKAVSDAFAVCQPSAGQRVYPVFFLRLSCGAGVMYDVNLAPNKRKVIFGDEDTQAEEVRSRALQTFQASADGATVARHVRIELTQKADYAATQRTQLTRTPVSATAITQFTFRRANPPPAAATGVDVDSTGALSRMCSSLYRSFQSGTTDFLSDVAAEKEDNASNHDSGSDTRSSMSHKNTANIKKTNSSSRSRSSDGDHSGRSSSIDETEAAADTLLQKEDNSLPLSALTSESGCASKCISRKRERESSPVVLTDEANQHRPTGPRVVMLFPPLDTLAQLPLLQSSAGVNALTVHHQDQDPEEQQTGQGKLLPPPSQKQKPRRSTFAGLTEQTERDLALHLDKSSFAAMIVHGQFNHGFILASLGNELFVIDQHAADEKYNYERLMVQHEARPQPLVAPVPVPMDPQEVELALQHLDALRRHGFIVRRGPEVNRLLVVAVPVLQYEAVGPHDVVELVQQLALYGTITRPLRSVWHSVATRACRSSIMIGTVLAEKTMCNVVRRLGELEHPWCCPHGRPTLRHVVTISSLTTT